MPARTAAALAWLERHGSRRLRDDFASRYGIDVPKAFGVPMGRIKQFARMLGRDHALALSLWRTGWYEARLLTAFVDDPARVTAAQMDRWARDFDNWGVVDTLCFAVRPYRPRLAQDQAVGRGEGGVREAGRLRPARLRGAARQEHR